MPTLKQRAAFKGLMETVVKGENKSKAAILREAGYGDISRSAIRVFDSKGFQELLSKINDEDILARVYEILNDDDKRSSLTAADMLLKLKNRYPDKQIRLGAIQQISDIYE